MKISASVAAALLPFLAYAAPAPQLGGGGGGNTSNDVKSGKCARVGPALKKQLGDGAAFQGVDYPADFGGNAAQTGNNPGVQPMIDDVNQALQKCPDTQVVLSGYSQGGIVTHGAMQKLPGGKVKAIVIFGDPLSKQKVANIDPSNVKIICNPGDGVCNDSFAISAAHLSYTTNGSVGQAVDFIKQKTGGGAGGDASSGSDSEGSQGGQTGQTGQTGSGGFGGLGSSSGSSSGSFGGLGGSGSSGLGSLGGLGGSGGQ